MPRVQIFHFIQAFRENLNFQAMDAVQPLPYLQPESQPLHLPWRNIGNNSISSTK
jgi:hypothetical protein